MVFPVSSGLFGRVRRVGRVGRVGLFFLHVEVNASSQWKIVAPVDGLY